MKKQEQAYLKVKRTSGITIIALVVTIIVLLIIAGVAIRALTGDNSLITQAQLAREQTIKRDEEEQVKLAVMAAMSMNATKFGNKLTESDLEKALKEYFPDAELKVSGPNYIYQGEQKYVINSRTGEVTVDDGSSDNTTNADNTTVENTTTGNTTSENTTSGNTTGENTTGGGSIDISLDVKDEGKIIELNKGETYEIEVSGKNYGRVVFALSDENSSKVIKVSDKGVVEAIGVGTGKVSITTTRGDIEKELTFEVKTSVEDTYEYVNITLSQTTYEYNGVGCEPNVIQIIKTQEQRQ